MRIDRHELPKAAADLPQESRKPNSPEEAARQFEEVLIKQMVQSMTKNLFDSSITGDDAPQWMAAYGDMQSDVLSTELSKQLGDSGKLGIAELLLKQWQRTGEVEADPDGAQPPDHSSDDLDHSVVRPDPVHPYTET